MTTAQPEASCPTPGKPWVQIVFSGQAWSETLEDGVLRELRIELDRRSLQVCAEPNEPPWAPPQKLITLIASDPERVAIVPSDLEHEGGFVGRTVLVGAIPEDARPLAIAQAVDEALRSDSGPAPEPPPIREKPVTRHEAPPPPARPALTVAAAVGGALQVAPATFEGATQAAVVPGITLRLSAIPSSVGGSLGITLTTASDLHFGSVVVRQFRLPVDGSLRVRIRKGQFQTMFDVGALAAIVNYDYAPNATAYQRFELGGRAGATVGWGRPLMPWLGASIEVLPTSAELRFAPTGTIGHTPTLWLGLALGGELSWP
ncbi:MAG TPA: hypothetical protein VF103_10790 [Polyangiaceae bacterium]